MTNARSVHGPVFTAASFGLLRLPVFPPERAARTLTGLDPEDRGQADRMAGYLRSVLGDDSVLEALTVSNPGLARELAKVGEARPIPFSRLRRMVYTVTKYLIRMSHRPTPFGLLAGVAPVTVGEDHRFEFRGPREKLVQADSEWLLGAVMRWERHPEVLPHLRLVRNDLAARRGERLVLSYVRDVDSKDIMSRTQEVSVRYTAAVRRALERAARPVPYPELAGGLADAFGAPVEAVHGMLVQLVEKEFLLTDLRPPSDAPDALAHVMEKLAPVTGLDDVPGLGDLPAAFREYARLPIGAGTARLRSLTAAMGRIQVTEHPLQIDLAVDADVRLPPIVTRQMTEAATVLWRMSPDPVPGHLRDYHDEFVERYGYGRAVPLKEMLDPERGLGAPATYLRPPSTRPFDNRERPRPERRELLAGLLQDAHRTGAAEVVLDDATVAALAEEDVSARPPAAFDMSATLLGASLDAVAAGDFRLVVSNGLGGPQPGAFFGRFLPLLGDTADRIRELYARPELIPGDALLAQVRFQPNSSRSGNVSRVPAMTAHQVVVGAFAERDDEGVHGIDDLAVTADRERFHVVMAATGRELVPMVAHMLNPYIAQPNAVRFLSEVTQVRRWGIRPWEWTGLDLFPHHPRVRYDRTVLASARWRLSRALRDPAASWPRWRAELDRWRERWSVPDLIEMTSDDQRVALDLTVPLHVRLLWREARREIPPVIRERPAGGEYGTQWCGGVANEIVVPMVPRPGSPATARPPSTVPVSGQPRHVPGGDWVFAKVYIAEDRQDELLTEYLPALLDAVGPDADRMFFIRYRDPAAHLRVRFHGERAVLNARLLPRLHDWAARGCEAGLMRKLVLDTYEPETVRYGGEKVLEHAERAFAADSEAVLRQLRAVGGGEVRLDPVMLAAANCIDVCRRFAADADWTGWFLDAYPKGPHHAAFQARRADARRLLDVTGPWAALAAEPGGAGILAAWRERAPALAEYGRALRAQGTAGQDGDREVPVVTSLLHMHCNRLLGIDPEAEQSAYAVARGAVAAHRDRVRFTR
ncbi:lantibiotic dehydratase [Planomonospora sp. ID91781]|uniref:lantibiotic dehydratase n=1 Tax=Planomonospora sp. ID91781 TaxID=2738135 RepID=UPI0018C4282D|nr:lantibiotic dehydratase [Planomonospora sp. ID91781]MBG0821737.1 lantibiotic dehydratase [Planomonospora sp. ID91781]